MRMKRFGVSALAASALLIGCCVLCFLRTSSADPPPVARSLLPIPPGCGSRWWTS